MPLQDEPGSRGLGHPAIVVDDNGRVAINAKRSDSWPPNFGAIQFTITGLCKLLPLLEVEVDSAGDMTVEVGRMVPHIKRQLLVVHEDMFSRDDAHGASVSVQKPDYAGTITRIQGLLLFVYECSVL